MTPLEAASAAVEGRLLIVAVTVAVALSGVGWVAASFGSRRPALQAIGRAALAFAGGLGAATVLILAAVLAVFLVHRVTADGAPDAADAVRSGLLQAFLWTLGAVLLLAFAWAVMVFQFDIHADAAARFLGRGVLAATAPLSLPLRYLWQRQSGTAPTWEKALLIYLLAVVVWALVAGVIAALLVWG